MNRFTPIRRWLADYAVPAGALVVLAWITYALFEAKPYAGFVFSGQARTVQYVFVPNAGLAPGDRLVSIGPVTLETYNRNPRQQAFEGVRPGEVVPIVVEREHGLETVSWTFPGPTPREIWERIVSNWAIGVIVLAAGWLTALVVRPRDTRWRLIVAFFCITGVGLAASAVSVSRVMGTLFVLRSAVWLAVPTYLHLHWQFPEPLRPLPRWFWGGFYAAAAGAAALEWFANWSYRPYLTAFAIAIAGSLLLLVVHMLVDRRRRAEAGLLALLAGLAFAPLLTYGVISLVARFPAQTDLAIPPLVMLPFIYLGTIFRRQLGGLHVRVNHYLSLFAFLMLLFSAGLALTALASGTTDDASSTLIISLSAGLAGTLATLLLLPPFERFFQRRVLGMQLPPDQVLETFSARIASSPSTEALAALLRQDVLPSLLVREALLLRVDPDGQPQVVLRLGEPPLPSQADLEALLPLSGRYRHPAAAAPQVCPWVRAPFVLRMNQAVVGHLLLGRRDPDDYYDRLELERIQVLAQQIAVALSHGQLTQLLRDLNLYTVTVGEAERASLARELHDGPMNRLSLLLQRLPPGTPLDVKDGLQEVIAGLRRTATGLRPPTLDYGLHLALRSLADELRAEVGPAVEITFAVTSNNDRYDPDVELHLFRIAQQAARNAARHAAARRIVITGDLAPRRVSLVIADDGRGFEPDNRLNLRQLLAERRFGLAGMHERALAVGARLVLDSTPEGGTRVQVDWQAH